MMVHTARPMRDSHGTTIDTKPVKKPCIQGRDFVETEVHIDQIAACRERGGHEVVQQCE